MIKPGVVVFAFKSANIVLPERFAEYLGLTEDEELVIEASEDGENGARQVVLTPVSLWLKGQPLAKVRRTLNDATL